MLRLLGTAVTLLIGLGAALYLLLILFSASITTYACEGEFTEQGESKAATIFAEFADYAWWVGLWSDSHGSLWVEVPGEYVDYFSDVRNGGRQLQIFGHDQEFKGQFSTLSKTLMLDLPGGLFEGVCQPAPPG